MNAYPKVLFINLNFSNDNSAGITVSKLFTNYPQNQLGLLSENAAYSDISICGHVYKLKTQNDSPSSIPQKYSFIWRSLKKVIKIFRKTVSRTIGMSSYFKSFKIDRNIVNWVQKFNPDFLYVNPENLSVINFTLRIALICNSKIIIHILDDKVNCSYKGILGPFYKESFRKKLQIIIDKASVRLSISDLMGDIYQKRYGKSFTPFHNPIDVDIWLRFSKKNWELSSKEIIKILYAGDIQSNWKSILKFCEAINDLVLNGKRFRFDIFTNYSNAIINKKFMEFNFIEIKEYVSQEKLPCILPSYDLLLLPLSFEPQMEYVKLSMPTKTAEYMISGVPICVLAPKDSALYKYAFQYHWAQTIDSIDSSIIKTKLFEILENEYFRQELATNALVLAQKKHSLELNKNMFYKLISKELTNENQ